MKQDVNTALYAGLRLLTMNHKYGTHRDENQVLEAGTRKRLALY